MPVRRKRTNAKTAPITPVDVPKGTKAVMVYGGTFDPPHFYHTTGPLSACRRLLPGKSWLLFVPAARNPLKTDSPGASDEHRVAMLRAAMFDFHVQRSIWTDEIDRAAWQRERGEASPSYTIDTLRRLRVALKRQMGAEAGSKVRLMLLIGVDQAANFHKWKDARQILKLAEIAVMPRSVRERGRYVVQSSTTPRELYGIMEETGAWTPEELVWWSQRLAPIIHLDVSSTAIRAAIPTAPSTPSRWESRRALWHIMPSVRRYIIEHKLYGFGSAGPKATTKKSSKSGAKKSVAGKARGASTKTS